MKKYTVLIFLSILSFSFVAKAETKEDYEKVYTIVQNEYVGDVSLEKFVVTGVKALSSVDKKLKIDQGYDNFTFVFADGKTKIFRKPRDKKSPPGWAESVINIVDTSVKLSPDLSLKDFELFDVINSASFKELDEFSRYFSSLEDEDENVKIRKYFGARMIDDVLYMKVKTFNKASFLKIKQTLEENVEAKGLILDLRGNRGGMLTEALKTADLFLDEGSLIAAIKEKNDEEPKIYTAKEPDSFDDKPIVLLVDGDTASSAEMLTAALKEQGRAYVLGTMTFGKGSVQNLHIIGEDKGFALTTAYFYSPQEKEIHKQGIKPDFCVVQDKTCLKQSREDRPEDIDEALKLIKQYL